MLQGHACLWAVPWFSQFPYKPLPYGFVYPEKFVEAILLTACSGSRFFLPWANLHISPQWRVGTFRELERSLAESQISASWHPDLTGQLASLSPILETEASGETDLIPLWLERHLQYGQLTHWLARRSTRMVCMETLWTKPELLPLQTSGDILQCIET